MMSRFAAWAARPVVDGTGCPAPPLGTRLGLAWSLLATIVSFPAVATTLSVGVGRPYATVASAIAAAGDGDVIEIQAGRYVNDFVTITKRLSLVGVGGMAELVATVPIPNGKGILIARNDLTLDYVTFKGARVADRNGAGIRYEGGALVVRQCYFYDNENGILANSSSTGTISIVRSEFAYNGRGDGYTHGIYVNQIAALSVTGNYFHHTKVGHHVKSRALSTSVAANTIIDGKNGTASYSIDAPNGGNVLIRDNNIIKSATSQNSALIHFGGESAPYAGSRLTVDGNVLQNDGASAIGVLNHTSVVVDVTRNRLFRITTPVSGPSTQVANQIITVRVPPNKSPPWQ